MGKREAEEKSEGDVTVEWSERDNAASFENGGRGHKPKNVGCL